jgi:DNA-binding transcriptional LysR family regulator
MDAADLAVFAAVARLGGINRAADELHTVQSNVTRRIRQLEAELGVPLFHRHSRGVTLTAAGAQLLPYATRIGHLMAEARRAAADGPVPSGRLCIGSLETTTARRLPPVLTAYATAHPRVDIELRTGTTASLLDDVLARRLEGAFVVGPVGHPDLVEETVLEEELVLVTAPWIPGLATLARLVAAGQVEPKILVLRAGCSYRERLEGLLAAHGIGGLRTMEFATVDGIVGCVAAGIGVTLLPRAVVDEAWRAGRVAVHDVPPEEARAPTVFVRRRDAFVSTALARFIECAHAHAAGAGAGGAGRRGARGRVGRQVVARAGRKGRVARGPARRAGAPGRAVRRPGQASGR